MISNPHNSMNSGEETLRLIAGLPAPAGLEERVHKALRVAPRRARVLAWPERLRAKTVLESNWMRAAAAAAIVFVVVGGGWGVYSRVQPGQAGKVLVMPQRMPSSGGFSGAGAKRTPATILGPKVREQATPASTNRSPGAPAGTEGTRDQGTQAVKKPAAAKKGSDAQPASQAAPQPVVSRQSATRPSSQP
jgi:hypothetical protein